MNIRLSSGSLRIRIGSEEHQQLKQGQALQEEIDFGLTQLRFLVGLNETETTEMKLESEDSEVKVMLGSEQLEKLEQPQFRKEGAREVLQLDSGRELDVAVQLDLKPGS